MSTPTIPPLSANSPPHEAESVPPKNTEAPFAHYQMWMAPFPPPQAVLGYEEILPGTWDRLLTMAEESQSADILDARTSDEYIHHDFRRGQVFGLLVMFAAMGCALYCVKTNQPWVAATFLSMTVMAVAKSFIASIRGHGHIPQTPDYERDGG